MTTTDICNIIVKPETKAQHTSYIDHFHRKLDANGRPFLAPATVFVSHAWKYKFSEPVDVMEQYEAENPNSYFWFDLLVNNQHDTSSRPQEWWKSTFTESIRQIGVVLLVLSPWNDPVPITRAWCLWEIMCALGQPGVSLVVRLPTAQVALFKTGVLQDAKSIMQVGG